MKFHGKSTNDVIARRLKRQKTLLLIKMGRNKNEDDIDRITRLFLNVQALAMKATLNKVWNWQRHLSVSIFIQMSCIHL